MSRADAFDAVYREARGRILHQTYAYAGDAEVAQKSTADAFVQAAHHWRKLEHNPDVEAWVRDRAFKASSRSLNRGLAPWYVRARKTDDAHRALLLGLSDLPPTNRKLVILRYLVGLPLTRAAREAGVPNRVAVEALTSARTVLGRRGVDASPQALSRRLADLRHDLLDAPIDRAPSLRREGASRRRKHLLLAGLCSVALAIGAGALVVADPLPGNRREPGPSGAASESTPTTTPEPEVSAAQLLVVARVRALDPGVPWRAAPVSGDLEVQAPYDVCLPVIPVDRRAEHFWVASMSGGGSPATRFTQSVEVSATPEASDRSFQRQLRAYTGCGPAARHLVSSEEVTNVGDRAAVLRLAYVQGAQVRSQFVAIARTGLAVTSLLVEPAGSRPVTSRQVLSVLGSATNSLCTTSQGRCALGRPASKGVLPTGDRGAAGLLAAVDLPLFAGLADPWVGTRPEPVRPNPAATLCDNANFLAAGARRVVSRYFVVPTAPRLADTFGMTQTIGSFADAKSARRFLATTAGTIAGCQDRRPSLEVPGTQPITAAGLVGQQWTIELRTSENAAATFRMALVRVGAHVTQLTFSPTERYDLTPTEFRKLALRAAQRLAQRP